MLSLSVRFAQAENEEIYKQHKCLLVGDWISAIVLMWYHRYTSCINFTSYMSFCIENQKLYDSEKIQVL